MNRKRGAKVGERSHPASEVTNFRDEQGKGGGRLRSSLERGKKEG